MWYENVIITIRYNKKMLEGFTKEELEEYKKECQEKYDKLFKETLQKAFTGEIGTNTQMVDELKDLNMRYWNEMNDYTDEYVNDLDGGFIEHFKKAEEDGKNVILEAKDCLECLGIATKVLNREEWRDENLNPVDEYGNRLSQDGEHRVFEVIKGNK